MPKSNSLSSSIGCIFSFNELANGLTVSIARIRGEEKIASILWVLNISFIFLACSWPVLFSFAVLEFPLILFCEFSVVSPCLASIILM